MRRRASRLAVAVWALLMALTHSVVAQSDDRPGLFAWFDTLGYDAVRSAQFVRIDTLFTSKGKTLYGPPTFGFLITAGKDFRILGTDLDIRRPDNPSNLGRLAYSPANFADWANRMTSKEWRAEDFSYKGDDLPPPALFFVASRACAGRGLLEQSSLLFQMAEGAKSWSNNASEDFAAVLMESVGNHAISASIGELRYLGTPRKDVADQLDRAVRLYPTNRRLRFASELADKLRAMQAEDDSHRMPADISKLSKYWRIAELIYELRDQTCRVSMGSDELIVPGTPAARLVKYGTIAAPELLDALEDVRPSRAIAQPAFGGLGPLPISEIVREILEQIANRSFPGRGAVSDEDRRRTIEKEARDWWASTQAKAKAQVKTKKKHRHGKG